MAAPISASRSSTISAGTSAVFTFYLAFALYLRATGKARDTTAIPTRGYWVLPVLAYASATIEYWGDFLLRDSTEITDRAGHVWHTGDIHGSVVLVSTFTMIFVCILGLMLVGRAVDAGPTR